MTVRDSVFCAFQQLIELHKDDIKKSNQAVMTLLPFAGHGDDIWLRLKDCAVVAEVTRAGAGKSWKNLNPKTKQKIVAKINSLRTHGGSTHRYLFLAKSVAATIPPRAALKKVKVMPLPV